MSFQRLGSGALMDCSLDTRLIRKAARARAPNLLVSIGDVLEERAHSLTTSVPSISSWPEPPNISQVNRNAPVLLGVKLTRLVSPGFRVALTLLDGV